MIRMLIALPNIFGELVGKRFEIEGYHVRQVEGGRDLLEKLRTDTFDVLLFPYLMTYYNGLEILDKIGHDTQKRTLLTIMTSHIHTSKLVESAYQLGLNRFYPAPVDIEEVVKYINNEILDSANSNDACLNNVAGTDREA